MATSSPYSSAKNKFTKNEDDSTPNNDDDLSSLTRKVEQNLRKNIRLFGIHPFASQSWIETAQRIADVANIVAAERTVAETNEENSSNGTPNTTGNRTGGSSSTPKGTLWETEEHALRILLEENKFSVLLRIGEEHVRNRKLLTSLSVSHSILTTPTTSSSSSSLTMVSLQSFTGGHLSSSPVSSSSDSSTSSSSTVTSTEESVSSIKLSELLTIFHQLEYGLTVLYTIAWLHPEITQLMDLPLVLTLYCETMSTAITTYSGDIGGSKQYTSSLTLFALGLSITFSLGTSILQGRTKSMEIILNELLRHNGFNDIIYFTIRSIELYMYHYNPSTHKLRTSATNTSATPTSVLPYQKPFSLTVIVNHLIGLSNLLNGEEYLLYKNKIINQILGIDNNTGYNACTKLRDYINSLILASNGTGGGGTSNPSVAISGGGGSNPSVSLSPNRIYASGGSLTSPSSSLIMATPSNNTNTVVRKQIRPLLDLLETVIRKK